MCEKTIAEFLDNRPLDELYDYLDGREGAFDWFFNDDECEKVEKDSPNIDGANRYIAMQYRPSCRVLIRILKLANGDANRISTSLLNNSIH